MVNILVMYVELNLANFLVTSLKKLTIFIGLYRIAIGLMVWHSASIMHKGIKHLLTLLVILVHLSMFLQQKLFALHQVIFVL
jgi:hypothetical protein